MGNRYYDYEEDVPQPGRKCIQCNGDISDYSDEYDRCVWCEYEVVGT